MSRREKRKLLKALEGLSTALRQSLEVAETAVSALAETRALLAQSAANAELWRQLYEQKPRFKLLLVSNAPRRRQVRT